MKAMRTAAIMVMSIVALVVAAQGQRAETSQGLDVSHEKAPTIPWMPRAAAASGAISHCGAWERDGFESIQVNVDARGCNIVGDAANETSIAVDPYEPRKIVIGWRQFDNVGSDFRQAGYAYSHDGGHTWVNPRPLAPGEMGTDPVLASGSSGEIYYLSTNFDELRFFTSTDSGLTWQKEVIATFFVDKPWITTDITGGIGAGNIYIWGADRLWRSRDSSWFEELFPGDLSPFVAMSVDVDGTLFLADPSSRFQKSDDVQDLSQQPSFLITGFAMRGFRTGVQSPPNPGGLCGQGWLATDHSNGLTRGNVYYLASVEVPGMDSLDVRFARSTDGGETWASSIRVNDDQPANGSYHWFGMMSVAPNGRIDAVWNDTRNGGGEPNLCELYHSFSVDAGETWSPNVPVSPMFDSWVGWPRQHKIGDYYHMLSDNLGVNVAYAATFNGEQDIYFLRIGPWDCNGNQVDDAVDISSEASSDCNGNDVPDECEYRVDIDGDGLTTIEDFTALAASMSDPPIAPLLTKEGAVGGPSSTRDAEADPPQSPLGKGGGTDSSASLQLDTEPLSYEATEGVEGGPPVAGAPGSDCFDLYDADHDGDIDLADFAYLQRVFVSP